MTIAIFKLFNITNMEKKLNFLIGGVVILIILSVAFGIQLKKDEGFGSVVSGGEYFSTTTGGNLMTSPQALLVNGAGVLGSVVITGANTGDMNFYNATTTNRLLRTNQAPTTTIFLASIPASAAAGTYTFDVNATVGLLVDLATVRPTSTITFKAF